MLTTETENASLRVASRQIKEVAGACSTDSLVRLMCRRNGENTGVPEGVTMKNPPGTNTLAPICADQRTERMRWSEACAAVYLQLLEQGAKLAHESDHLVAIFLRHFVPDHAMHTRHHPISSNKHSGDFHGRLKHRG